MLSIEGKPEQGHLQTRLLDLKALVDIGQMSFNSSCDHIYIETHTSILTYNARCCASEHDSTSNILNFLLYN
jgi:hypothetical protein